MTTPSPSDRDPLVRARDTADWDAAQGSSTSHSPDDRTIPFLLAGILDALIAIAERLPDDGRTAVCPHGMTGLCMYCVRDFNLLGGGR
jgi:hypothetical protein